MFLSELQFDYPEELVAREPRDDFRTLLVTGNGVAQEINRQQIFDLFSPGDLLVVNDTKVLKRRVFSNDQIEILFLKDLADNCWQVLFPARAHGLGSQIQLPGEVILTLTQKGLPQIVQASKILDENYFSQFGEMPLPPYIQKARHERHNTTKDESWYQTSWASEPGSFAAPTASLHFTTSDLEALKQKGVKVARLTLHVGLGTFLPVRVENLNDHVMHGESALIPVSTWAAVNKTLQNKNRVWALGTTVTRALESMALGMFEEHEDCFIGETQLLIQPGHKFKVVGGLLTNFHQPESTLLALVSAFAGLENVKAAYQWAIKNKFRLFSYGDLSIWTK
jgi:S-adenosylmethionine:tRNA ribosyltransferase-isomerase